MSCSTPGDAGGHRTVVHTKPGPDLGGFAEIGARSWDEEVPVLDISLRLTEIVGAAG